MVLLSSLIYMIAGDGWVKSCEQIQGFWVLISSLLMVGYVIAEYRWVSLRQPNLLFYGM
jgi:hypothetical protein